MTSCKTSYGLQKAGGGGGVKSLCNKALIC